MRDSLPQRKRPVHMPPVGRHNAPVILFVTLGIQPRCPALANTLFKTAFAAGCRDADAWSAGYYLIMPDHVHLFCAPAQWPRVPIRRWSAYLKERITKRLNGAQLDGSAQPRPPMENRIGCVGELEGEPVVSRDPCGGSWDTDGSAQPRPPMENQTGCVGELEGEPVVSRDPCDGSWDAVGSAQPRPPMENETGCVGELEGEPAVSRDPCDGLWDTDGSAQPRPPMGGRAGRVVWRWQSDCWDTQMRNPEHYHEKWEYVRQNPARKGLINRAEDWPWQGQLNVLSW